MLSNQFDCLQERNPHACLVFYWEPLNRQVSYLLPLLRRPCDQSNDVMYQGHRVDVVSVRSVSGGQ